LNKTKTFSFSSQISKTRTELFEVSKKIWKLKKSIALGPKISRSERERFGSTMNFGNVCRKTKANDLEKTLVWHYYPEGSAGDEGRGGSDGLPEGSLREWRGLCAKEPTHRSMIGWSMPRIGWRQQWSYVKKMEYQRLSIIKSKLNQEMSKKIRKAMCEVMTPSGYFDSDHMIPILINYFEKAISEFNLLFNIDVLTLRDKGHVEAFTDANKTSFLLIITNTNWGTSTSVFKDGRMEGSGFVSIITNPGDQKTCGSGTPNVFCCLLEATEEKSRNRNRIQTSRIRTFYLQ
jgi:hypothetical protein